MNHIRNGALILVLGLFFLVPVFGQDAAPASAAPVAPASPYTFGLSGSLGSEIVGGTTYNTIGLLPDFGFGQFGVGVDLSMHFLFYNTPGGPLGFYPRSQDWYDPGLTVQQNVGMYLARIAYLRWGHKGDPLYLQAGLLPSVTLGDGFTVGGYDNGILRPDIKYIGAEADVDGKLFDFPWLGLESVVGNLSAWDVLALRLYSRPLGLFFPENGFLKAVEFGLTGALDTNPYTQDPNSLYQPVTGQGIVSMVDLDTLVPLYNSPLFSAQAFGDLGAQGKHIGGMIGVGGKTMVFLNWGLENLFLGQDYQAHYFDQGYDIERTQKYLIYTDHLTIPGYIGYQLSLGTSFLDDEFVFSNILEGPYGSVPGLVGMPEFSSQLAFNAKGFPVSLSAYYIKQNLSSLADLASAENALVGASTGLTFGSATITLLYSLHYVAADDPAFTGNHWVTTSTLQTTVKFF